MNNIFKQYFETIKETMLLNNRYDNTKTMSTMYTIRITIQINNMHNTNNIQTMKITTQNNK